MSEKLLICIAFHFVESRLKYLTTIVTRFLETYQLDVHIIIDTNSTETEVYLREKFSSAFTAGHLETCIHETLTHPFHLTWCHRFHFLDKIEEYDYFYYTEDDMDLPWENFKHVMDMYPRLWPHAMPGLLRVEEKGGEWFCSDATFQHTYSREKLGTMPLLPINPEYHGVWMMPKEILMFSLTSNFARWETQGFIREVAASFPNWELKKHPLVLLEPSGQVSKLCWINHLPANYANQEGTPLGKLKVTDLIRLV